MPKQSFALEAGGSKRLDVSWKGTYNDVTVALDGIQIGTISTRKALTAGQDFLLSDGSTLRVQLASNFLSNELRILRNGQPLPGSASDPETRLKNAYWMVYFVAGLNLLLGLLAVLVKIEFLQQIGIGWYSIIFGLVFLVLGFFVQRKSNVALILAIAIFALDGILGLVLSAMAGVSPSIGGLLARVFLLVPMIQGVGAIKLLNDKNG